MYIYITTTFTNPEGFVITCTNDFPETILSQLNSSNSYYTSGEHDIIFLPKWTLTEY